jgi:hypothetical protein
MDTTKKLLPAERERLKDLLDACDYAHPDDLDFHPAGNHRNLYNFITGSLRMDCPSGRGPVYHFAEGLLKQNPSNVDIALSLAERPWFVFPCGTDKRPLTAHGFEDASADPDTIKDWWRGHPEALVGIACEMSGIFALDIDRKPGKADGLLEWEKIQTENERVKTGPTQDTINGGLHLIFEYPQNVNIPNRKDALAPGVDVRSAGYICTGKLPNGRGYAWHNNGHGMDAPIPVAPAWLIGMLTHERKPAQIAKNYSAPAGDKAKWASELLSRLNPWRCDDYQGWVDVGMALSELGADGLALWDIWSRGSAKYSPGECDKKWKSFEPGTGITLGSLYHWASEDNPQPTTERRDYTPPEPEIDPIYEWTEPAVEFDADEEPVEIKPRNALGAWQPFTLRDAYTPRPPVQYAVGKLFELPSLNIVFGSPGCMKSFVLADMACCIAAGVPWLGPLPGDTCEPIAVKQSPVMWLDFDNGKRRTHDRFAALARARNLPDDAPIYYYSMPSPWLNASDKNHVAALVEVIKQHGAKVVVIDNLGVIAPDVDENSADMIAVMAHLRWIAEESGAALVVIHHQRKSNGNIGRAGENLRGFSGIEAALDRALLVEREEKTPEITIKSTKDRGVTIYPFGGIFTFENDENDEIKTARFFGKPMIDPKSIAGLMKIIAETLGRDEMTKGDLVEAVKEELGKDAPGVNKIRSTIDLMMQEERILKNSGENNSQMLKNCPKFFEKKP